MRLERNYLKKKPKTNLAPTSTTSTGASASSTTPVAAVSSAPTVTTTNTPTSMGEDYEKAVTEMLSMGYLRPQIDAAMRAAFNNPDRAVEYLLSV